MRKKVFDLRRYMPLASLGLGIYGAVNLINFFNDPIPSEIHSLRDLSAYVQYYDGGDLDISKDYVLSELEEIGEMDNIEIDRELSVLENKVENSVNENFMNISKDLKEVAADCDYKTKKVSNAFFSWFGGFVSFALYMDYHYEKK